MLLAGTGHRPPKVGNWDDTSAFYRLVELAIDALEEHEPTGIVSGGACGWDLALAHAAIELNIHLMMAIPFKGQSRRWSSFWQQLYGEAMDYATRTEILYTPNGKPEIVRALLDRNKWMVDFVKGRGKVLALWNGDNRGGTAHCVRYANSQGVEVINLWDRWINTK